MIIAIDTHKTADGKFEFHVYTVEYQKASVTLKRQGGYQSRAVASHRGKGYKRYFKASPEHVGRIMSGETQT